MRVLEFKGDTIIFYDVLYQGLAATVTQGIDTRIISRIFSKMDLVGLPNEKLPQFRTLKGNAAVIPLEDAEYDTLKKVLDRVEWNGLGAKNAGMFLDWLDAIPITPLKVEK